MFFKEIPIYKYFDYKHSHGTGLNVCMPPKSYFEILTHKLRVTQSRALERSLVHGSGALVSGINAVLPSLWQKIQ